MGVEVGTEVPEGVVGEIDGQPVPYVVGHRVAADVGQRAYHRQAAEQGRRSQTAHPCYEDGQQIVRAQFIEMQVTSGIKQPHEGYICKDNYPPPLSFVKPSPVI